MLLKIPQKPEYCKAGWPGYMEEKWCQVPRSLDAGTIPDNYPPDGKAIGFHKFRFPVI
jgi:hypothetical protein